MSTSVAVVIPTYNRVEALGRALDSVYAQARQPDEVCVVDDGSTDGTKELVVGRYPEVIYIKQKNSGVSAARNAGVAATTSRYLAFLDSDDEWLPQKLEQQLNALEANSTCKLVHSDEIWIRNGRRVNQMDKHRKRGGDIFEYCLGLCVISPSAVVLERLLFDDLGGFDESLPACEDYDLWLRLCSQERVLYLDEALLKKYGGHSDQLSRQYWGMDRFRVTSLLKLLESGYLSEEQERLTRITLREKAKILRDGAIKRDKADRAEYYSLIIKDHCAELSEI